MSKKCRQIRNKTLKSGIYDQPGRPGSDQGQYPARGGGEKPFSVKEHPSVVVDVPWLVKYQDVPLGIECLVNKVVVEK